MTIPASGLTEPSLILIEMCVSESMPMLCREATTAETEREESGHLHGDLEAVGQVIEEDNGTVTERGAHQSDQQ